MEEKKIVEQDGEVKNGPKKLTELTTQELWAYYEMAQKRFDQVIHYNRMNNQMGMNNAQSMDMNRKREIVDRLTSEIDRRLHEDIDWRK